MLAFINKVKTNRPEFEKKVIDIARTLETDPNWLMGVMNAESGLNHQAQNLSYPLAGGPATGLIQFTPDTAISLGTTIAELKAMNNLRQLDYVEAYYLPYKGKLNSYFDAYVAVFFPAAIGKADEWIFETKNISRSAVARQNPGIDENKNGEITVAEFKGYLYRTIPAALRNLIFTVKKFATSNPVASIAIVATLFFLVIRKLK